MTSSLAIDPKTSALLVIDFQTAVVEMVPTDSDALLARTAKLIEAARRAGVKVIYVVVGFRLGYPEVSPRNQSFGPIRASGRFAEGSAGTEVQPSVAPKPSDVVVTKHRVSAFAGTDLEMVLRANGIDTLVLAGIATSGVVLSTIRHAADADYKLFVVEDCRSNRDPEVHRVLTEKVFIRQATGGGGCVTATYACPALCPSGNSPAAFDLSCNPTDLTSVVVSGPCATGDTGLSGYLWSRGVSFTSPDPLN